MNKNELILIQEKNYIHNKIQTYIKRHKEELFKEDFGDDLQIETEVPLFSGTYNQGTVDAIINGSKGKAIVEVKSYLYDTSGCIRQLKIYKHLIKADKLYLVTILDETKDETDLIELLESENIKLINVKVGLLRDAKLKCIEQILIKLKELGIDGNIYYSLVEQVMDKYNESYHKYRLFSSSSVEIKDKLEHFGSKKYQQEIIKLVLCVERKLGENKKKEGVLK